MDDLDKILAEATKKVDVPYFLLPIAGLDSKYRERVYCYELYHQMRMLWPSDSPLLMGEVDKAGHPNWLTRKPKPDFLIHEPGSQRNHMVIEVKPSSRSLRTAQFLKDIECLSSFVHQAGYQRAIYLIYGNESLRIVPKIQKAAGQVSNLAPIELWLHSSAGHAAERYQILRNSEC